MSRAPRILPLVGVSLVGVLAVNALAGARDLPGLIAGARAFAEEAVKSKAEPKKDGAGETAATGEAKEAVSAMPPQSPQSRPNAVCAPTAAELAKEAGLSPAELQVLQNLGVRRGQLDQRESDMDTQLALMAAAEAKLDAKIRTLSTLKIDVQNLLSQANTKEAAEIDRLVKVFESMKPKDSAPRMMVLDDSVRIPIAAKMKDRALSAMLAQMPPDEAKKITEALARQFAAAQQKAEIVNAQLDAAKASTDPAKLTAAKAAKKTSAPPPAAGAKPPAKADAGQQAPAAG